MQDLLAFCLSGKFIEWNVYCPAGKIYSSQMIGWLFFEPCHYFTLPDKKNCELSSVAKFVVYIIFMIREPFHSSQTHNIAVSTSFGFLHLGLWLQAMQHSIINTLWLVLRGTVNFVSGESHCFPVEKNNHIIDVWHATGVNNSRVTVNCFLFDVTVFAMLPAHGIWQETVSLSDVMWPWTSQWMCAL